MNSHRYYHCLLLLITSTLLSCTNAFAPTQRRGQISISSLNAVKQRRFDPSYNKKPPVFNKSTSSWEPSTETEDEAYGPFGSFLRGGPSPFLVRIIQPSQYDQAVFKYMAQTSCSRAEAQGNMDAYFNNAADWAYQKQEEANGRPVVDYTELKPKQAILVITWALFVTPFLGRCGYLIAFGDKGWGIGLDDIFNF
eukprot:scaffold35498_cov52-Cyclotella_meneghiniana.AAC.2